MAILEGVVGGLRGWLGVLRAAIWETLYLRDIRPKNRLGTDFGPFEVGRLAVKEQIPAVKEQIPVVNRVKTAKMAILAVVVGGLRGWLGVLRAAIWDTYNISTRY